MITTDDKLVWAAGFELGRSGRRFVATQGGRTRELVVSVSKSDSSVSVCSLIIPFSAYASAANANAR